MKKINLVLSGGGARGIAHLGVIKALHEFDFKINSISGVSSGAIAGAFIAKGMTPDEILEIAISTSAFNLRRPPFRLGLFNKKNMRDVLLKYFHNTTFSDLSIPLHIAATNINTCNTDYFSSGDLVLPLIASSAIPVFFSPVKINGYQYIDGAVANNLPVEPFLKNNLPRIGVCVNLYNDEDEISSTIKVLVRAIQITVNKSAAQRKPYCQLVIEPEKLSKYTAFDFSKSRDIFNVGYENARVALDKFIKQDEYSSNPYKSMHAA